MSFIDDDMMGAAALREPDDPERTRTRTRTNEAIVSATLFARIMSRAFLEATRGGKQFDDVLKSVALRLSSMAVMQAFKPLSRTLAGSLNKAFANIFGDAGDGNRSESNDGTIMNAVTPFASGGVIGAPGYFPLASGGFGLAGEAGPEAIMPLTRGRDGRLGVASSSAGAASITVQIATPDADSFRRSEAYVTGQIARAVARGQRGF